MSRRTSEASKAIRDAWKREQKLVSEGKATRDWTLEQQKEILELGKVYYHSKDPDDINEGKAFEGHHMKSAEAYPEYQGDSENIQFLSRSEHQEAHGGDFRNHTNGYFDPVTKITLEFGDNKYEPCKIINLTNPIVKLRDIKQVASETTETAPEKDFNNAQRVDNSTAKKPRTPVPPISKTTPKAGKGFVEKIIDSVEVVKGFGERHPVLKNILKFGGLAAVAIGTKVIVDDSKRSEKSPKTHFKEDHLSISSDDCVNSLDTDNYDVKSSSKNYPEKRSSPKKHTVTAHGQHYRTNDGVIWKEKEPFPRGGKRDDN